MAVVTLDTNRIDLFCIAHFGSASDAVRRRFMQWNSVFFADRNRTFWLPIGVDLYTVQPPVTAHNRLLVEPRTALNIGNGHLRI